LQILLMEKDLSLLMIFDYLYNLLIEVPESKQN
jgi:hypothetical protein